MNRHVIASTAQHSARLPSPPGQGPDETYPQYQARRADEARAAWARHDALVQGLDPANPAHQERIDEAARELAAVLRMRPDAG